MSAQLNDPPVFGGLANTNIRANVNTPLDLTTSGNNGYALPNAPTLTYIRANDDGTATVTVDLQPYNYPPQDANVIFKFRVSGTQTYANFPNSVWDNQPPLNAWLGFGDNFLQGTSYEVIATSGIFISPILRFATGTYNPGNPTGPPTVPALGGVPTDTSMVVYFNGGFTGRFPNTYTFSIQTSANGVSGWSASSPATSVFGSLWSYIATGLAPSTAIYFRSVVSYNGVTFNSASSPAYSTAASGGTAPAGTLGIPTLVSATSNSITVTYTGCSAVTGTAPITFGVLLTTSNTGSPVPIFISATVVGDVATATATGLVASQNYYFESIASNSVGSISSTFSAAFQTASTPPPATKLKTNIVTPFLIQGPRFNVPYSQALDYYINVDAVGCFYTVGTNTRAQGNQLYGSMYGNSYVTGSQPNLAGFCIADQPYNEAFGPTSDAYLKNAQSRTNNGQSVRLLASWGGFYADILGLFGPYQPAGYPGTNPSSIDVTKSFLFNFCGIASATNPLNWSRKGYTTYYDGLILDFECVGYGGNPNVGNQYPLPQSPLPSFPASATNATYTAYPQALADILTTWYTAAPTLYLGNAPVSLSINGDATGGARNGNISAANSALNTWFAFATSATVPSAGSYNATASLALNHPTQLSYFDDIFVQFYNENKDNYLGGGRFIKLQTQWGYVAILAQKLGRKKTLINIGLASGNIIPGYNAQGNAIVPNAQGPTPQLDGEPGPPFTFWYPQYGAASPPNQTNPAASQTWPNTGPTLDAVNLENAISKANTILQNAFGNPSLIPSSWCSGTGFWAGGNASTTANQVYSGKSRSALSPGTILPATNVYLWSDASYPSPDPLWTAQNLPVNNRLTQ